MPTYTQQQIENVWFALNLNRLKPNNDANSGAGLHNPNGSINMYKWLQDALDLLNISGSITSITEGTDITITGTGTTLDPYVINYSGAGGGTNIYNANGTLTANRTLSFSTDKTLTFSSTSTPFTTTLWTSNAFIQTIGKPVGTVDLDTRSQIVNTGVGVLKSAGLNAQIYKDGDVSIANIAVSSTGSGIEDVRAIMEIENRIDNNNIFFELYSQVNGAYPWAKLVIPTNYQYGQGVDVLDYMVPSKVHTLNDELRYTYPLQRTVFNFGDANYRAAVNDYATGALATGHNGDKMTAVEVIISARLYANSSGTLGIRIIEASSGSDLYAKSIDMSTLPNTYGTMSQESISLPLNIDEQYYCIVTITSGDGTNVRGLSVTLLTI